MTNFKDDHFKIGWWVAFDEYRGGPRETPFGQVEPKIEFDGAPMKILAVSMPFICVTNGRGTFAIDTREWGIRIVNGRYVRKMMESIQIDPSEAEKVESPSERKSRIKRSKPDKRDCPRCGTRKVERAIFKAGKESKWKLICPQCGHGGEDKAKGPVPRGDK